MLNFRKLEEADIDRGAALEEKTFSDAWTRNSIYETFCQGQAFITVAEEDGEVSGYCIIYYVLDEGEISDIGTHEERVATNRNSKTTDKDKNPSATKTITIYAIKSSNLIRESIL